MNKVTYRVDEIIYKGKHRGIIIGTYSHKFKLKYHPLFATLLKNGGSISETTRQKDGVIYIPIDRLKGVSKIKIVSGKGDNFTYRLIKDIEILSGGFIVRGEATDYNKQGRIDFNHNTKG